MNTLSDEQIRSVKKSYLNIVALFLEQGKMESRYLRCLLKWGFQLRLSPDDLSQEKIDLTELSYSHPDHRADQLEAIYHLTFMIYLDRRVEDVELEVATIYAEKLGFKAQTVTELFNSIATADYDGRSSVDVRQEVFDFLKLYES